MTVSVQIANVGNTEGDEVVIEWRNHPDDDWTPIPGEDCLARGETTGKLGVASWPKRTEFRIRGVHGTGKYVGELCAKTEAV